LAVEIGLLCVEQPDPRLIERFVGPLMTAVLGSESVGSWIDVDDDVWQVAWGGAVSSQAVLLSRGSHEFGEGWFLTVSPGERGQELSLLLAVVVAVSASILHDGRILDELALVGGGTQFGSSMIAKLFRQQSRSPGEVLAVLREGS
jgi:hypothetical protein